MIEAARVPGATYRLQFNGQFRFKEALRLVPYLADLGITDLYASPFLKAAPGSTHGYDVSNHNEVNPEIGSEEEYSALVDALRERGMGVLLDVVPNHMGVGSNDNLWWNDVLENGPISMYAPYFDVDWTPLQTELQNKVLLPMLGDQYGRVLENGELKLLFRDGAFFLTYYERELPIAPSSYLTILAGPCDRLSHDRPAEDEALVELQSIMTAVSHLPSHVAASPEEVAEHNREKDVIKRRLAALVASDAEVGQQIEAEITRLNGRVGDPRSFDALDAILNEQAYRLAFWRVASEEINYRRFFDINTLAAITMENPEVFAATHALIFRLIREDKAHGLRIDHPDGLLDPGQYFERLQSEFQVQCSRFQAPRPGTWNIEPGTSNALYVVAEKILAQDEVLPETWAVHGTTGYDFMNAVGGIFVDATQRRRFDELYARFIGHRLDFPHLVYESKRRIMNLSLASEINVLAWQLNNLSERDRRFRDFTLYALRDAVREVIACFPVYRTYINGRPVSDRDRSEIDLAVRWARRRNPASEASVFNFLRDVLLLRAIDPADEEGQALQLHFVQKFQQTTGPVTAKSVEDTSFYIYNRLVSLNEVGGEPDPFGVSVEAFHRLNAERREHWPHTLLSTSTHDTKRSEDVRARISALSEMPAEWSAALTRWSRRNRRLKGEVDGPAPSANDEYLLYQILLGAWPLEEPDDDVRKVFVQRIQEYMAKATREAKAHTSWINPNEAYDEAMARFVAAILDPARSSVFLDHFARLWRVVARVGAVNSLGQTLVKLTVPGVPDIYRGNELWDFSLVDPDNRRPVDFRLRQRLLGRLQRAVERAEEEAPSPGPSPASRERGETTACLPSPSQRGGAGEGAARGNLRRLARALAEEWTDGRVKQYVTWRTLNLRRERAALFKDGAYLPLAVDGSQREHVFAFARELEEEQVIVAVPRLVCGLLEEPDEAGSLGPLRFQQGIWKDTRLLLPDRPGRRYTNLFTGDVVETSPARAGTIGSARSVLALDTLLSDFPVTLLTRELP